MFARSLFAAATLASATAFAADVTIQSSESRDISSQTLSGDTVTNNGTIKAYASYAEIDSSVKFVNNGLVYADSAQIRLDSATIEHNGTFQSANSAAAIHVNFARLPLQTITGTGNWDIGNGLNSSGRTNIASNQFKAQLNAIINFSGGDLSFSELTGGGNDGNYSSSFGIGNNSTLTIRDGGNKTFASDLNGGFLLIKNGSGTQTLSGLNQNSGGTTVNGGILRVNATTATGYSTTTVNAAGTLSALGELHAFGRINGGTLSIGDVGTVGTLKGFGMRFAANSTLQVDLSSTATSDRLTLQNADLLVDNLAVDINNMGLSVGSTVTFMDWSDILFVNAAGQLGQQYVPKNSSFKLAANAPVAGFFTVTNTYDGNLNYGSVSFTVTAVPEPTTLATLAASALLLRRRR